MNAHATNLDCTLACPWTNTSHCLRRLVQQSVLLSDHLGGAQLSGVQSMYYPLALPPCVRADGNLHWGDAEADLEESSWSGDGLAM